jgi:DNA-binding IclR family transcriptional regulator
MKNTRRNPVDKAFVALNWLIGNAPDEVGVREMATALKVAPSTAHRLLHGLAQGGLVRQSGRTGRYSLGLELFRLAQLVMSRAPIQRIALSHLRELVKSCNETAYLGLYESSRQEMIITASVDSTNALRYAVALDQWMPVYAGASGLAIMAFLSKEEQKSIVERTRLKAITEQTITEPYRLDRELAKIRERGYAVTRGQRIPGAVGVAAPIFNISREAIGDVCLTIPEARYSAGTEAELGRLVKACAAKIDADFGATLSRRSRPKGQKSR